MLSCCFITKFSKKNPKGFRWFSFSIKKSILPILIIRANVVWLLAYFLSFACSSPVKFLMSSVSGNIQHVVCAGRVRPHLWPFTKSEMTASAYGSFHCSEREQLPHCFHHDHDSIALLLWICQAFSLSVADGNPKISLGWGLEAKKHQFQTTSVINLCPTHIFFKPGPQCAVSLCLKSAQWLRKSLLDSTECVFSCKIASFLHYFKLVLNKMSHARKPTLDTTTVNVFQQRANTL